MIPNIIILLIICIMATPATAWGEFRAYLMEVYDQIDKKKWETVTGFSPDEYILTHGGGNRLSVIIKATWHCYGDTSGFKNPCAMPSAVDPLFKKGDRVRIDLKRHITDGWLGNVELSLYRKDLNSNVYGVRFDSKRKLYGRYFEFNLKKVETPTGNLPDDKADINR